MKKNNLILGTFLAITAILFSSCGKSDQFKHGGFVVYEKNGHGLVAATTDLGREDWESAKWVCDKLILNGYSDWHLPTKEENYALYVNFKQLGVGGFDVSSYYWSSTEYYNDGAWVQDFDNGEQNYSYRFNLYYVRAVRAF